MNPSIASNVNHDKIDCFSRTTKTSKIILQTALLAMVAISDVQSSTLTLTHNPKLFIDIILDTNKFIF